MSQSASFNSATALTPWMTRRLPTVGASLYPLQFGHGTDAVDDAGKTPATRHQFFRFNSATALTPWMTGKWVRACGIHQGFNSATALTPWMTTANFVRFHRWTEASIRPRH